MSELESIQPLDSDHSDRFIQPAYRLVETFKRVKEYYHAHPIQPDASPDYEAVQAWIIVTCCYSGIEQSTKCLLQISGSFIDKPKKEGGQRHHKIGGLFQDLSPCEKLVLRTSFEGYRSFHDYIPSETLDCFLTSIDDGYPKWRYFPLEGGQLPTTHCGAMVEVWHVLSEVLRARVFGNHEFKPVRQRLVDRLSGLLFGESWDKCPVEDIGFVERDDLNRWIGCQGGIIAAFADLFHPSENNYTTLSLQPTTLQVLETAAALAVQDMDDQDFHLYVRRARVGDLPREFLRKPF